jgi:hypothetical protein
MANPFILIASIFDGIKNQNYVDLQSGGSKGDVPEIGNPPFPNLH